MHNKNYNQITYAHFNSGNAVYVQPQQLNNSQLSYVSLQSNQNDTRNFRQSFEDKIDIKPIVKLRENSEQRKPQKVDVVQVQNRSQLIYGSGSFAVAPHLQKPIKMYNTLSSFKEMNIRIQDVNTQQPIPEDPNELLRNSVLVPSTMKRDANREWNDILMKTKSLEENLNQLKTSINNNLKKIQRSKEQSNPQRALVTKGSFSDGVKYLNVKNQRSEVSLILTKSDSHSNSNMVKNAGNIKKNFLKNKKQEAIEELNRLSKESTQSKKYSTQSVQGQPLIQVDKSKQLQSPQQNFPKQFQSLSINQFKVAPNQQGLSHNPSQSSINNYNQTQLRQNLVSERSKPIDKIKPIIVQKEMNLQNESTIIAQKRINSPQQSKIIKEKEWQSVKGHHQNVSQDRKNQQSMGQLNYQQPTKKVEEQFYQAFNKVSKPLTIKQDMQYLSSSLKDRLTTGQFIGRGRFSDVYLAKYIIIIINNIEIRILGIYLLQKLYMEEQLVREIKTQSLLQHPNIVKLFGTFYDEDKIYLVLEYCSEGELFQLQYKQTQRKFEESKSSSIICQILEAISYMHKMNVMHRDLKTENILLSYGQIKLCDLGCVCDVNEQNAYRTTFCGTVDYIAPEVITGGGPDQKNASTLKGYDQRCDIWQIAVLAFELSVGRTPFTDNGPRNEDKIMQNILKKEVLFPTETSKELQEFVTQGLQKDPERRITLQNMIEHPWIQKYIGLEKVDLSKLLNK